MNRTIQALVVGLGSMGNRRIRCLKKLGVSKIYGVDLRVDRRQEVTTQFGVDTFKSLEKALMARSYDVILICLPPAEHVEAMLKCVKRETPFFVEASVLSQGLEEVINLSQKNKVIAIPSATFLFHPAVKLLQKIVAKGKIGKISNILFHSGQYLEDWHPYEPVSDFYVSTKSTGGAREIVPFEMTWFTRIFGFPKFISANYRKTIEIPGAESIDDTYNCLLDYGNFLASITVDVVSRKATRRLLINGSKGQLIWSWDDNVIRIFDGQSIDGETLEYEKGFSHPGYNPNIDESMYMDETAAFLAAVEKNKPFPNTLEDDFRILQLLNAFEEANNSLTFVKL